MNTEFIVAAVVLLVIVGGLLFWVLHQEAEDRKKDKPQHS
jgi:hypothetical protein